MNGGVMPATESLQRRRWIWLGGYLGFGLLIGCLDFFDQPLSMHFDIAKFLATMAATLFGILGIWIAVLDPKGLLNASVQEPETPEQRLMLKLLGPWLNATVTFVLALFFVTLLGFMQPSTGGESSIWMLRLATSVNLFLLLLILDGVIGTLVPIVYLRREMKLRVLRKANRGE